MNREIIYTDRFVDGAAQRIFDRIARALTEDGYCTVSLCGGRTPFPVYERLAALGSSLDWSRICISFGDERCVPPDHSDSTYRAAKASLLDRVPIPEKNILRMQGEIDPTEAALLYDAALGELRKKNVTGTTHHLVLLGIGDDGHTASLFPGSLALEENNRLVVANRVAALNVTRLTTTYQFLNNARSVFFLVNDRTKESVVQGVIAGRKE
jgi:6-phosphogluconolactonase